MAKVGDAPLAPVVLFQWMGGSSKGILPVLSEHLDPAEPSQQLNMCPSTQKCKQAAYQKICNSWTVDVLGPKTVLNLFLYSTKF